MAKQVVHSDRAPKAIGPYSQAISARPLVFVSGQTPIIPETGQLVSDLIAEQTKQCLENVTTILKAAGLSLKEVVKTTVFLTDMADFAAMNTVYASFFITDPPARSTIAVAALPMGARVEIEAIAIKESS